VKSKEQFKSSIYKKRDLYYAEQHRKCLQFMKIATPVAACFILAFTIFMTPLRNMLIPVDEATPENHLESSLPTDEVSSDVIDDFSIPVLSIEINTNTEDEGIYRLFRTTEKINSIISYIDDLIFFESQDMVDENDGTVITITVNYPDSEKNYYLRDDALFRNESGDWKTISKAQADRLKQLIESLESD